MLTVSLDRTLESLTFGDRSCINSVACFEDVSLDLASKCVLFCILKLELSYESLAGNAGPALYLES